MSAARNPYQARTLRRIRTMLRRKRKPQQTWQRPGAQRRRQQRRRPPRHEDRAGDRIAPTRSGREVGRADRRHGVVAPYRASRADRPPPSRLRRPPGAWRNRPRLGLPRRRDSRGQRVIPMRLSPKSLARRPKDNSAAEPHGRTATGSLDQNDSGATNGPEIEARGTASAPDNTSQVSDRLAVLAELSLADLRLEWRRLFRADPPRLSRDIIVRRLQAATRDQ